MGASSISCSLIVQRRGPRHKHQYLKDAMSTNRFSSGMLPRWQKLPHPTELRDAQAARTTGQRLQGGNGIDDQRAMCWHSAPTAAKTQTLCSLFVLPKFAKFAQFDLRTCLLVHSATITITITTPGNTHGAARNAAS
jgi:hypothetical protein